MTSIRKKKFITSVNMGLNLLVILNEKKINKYLIFDDNNK